MLVSCIHQCLSCGWWEYSDGSDDVCLSFSSSIMVLPQNGVDWDVSVCWGSVVCDKNMLKWVAKFVAFTCSRRHGWELWPQVHLVLSHPHSNHVISINEWTLSYATPQCVGILLLFYIIQVTWLFDVRHVFGNIRSTLEYVNGVWDLTWKKTD